MKVGLCTDPRFLEHVAPPGHPERPERLRAIAQRLDEMRLKERCGSITPRLATRDEVIGVHSAAFFDEMSKNVPGKKGHLDPDTYYSPGSWEAALLAAGSVVDATKAVLTGELDAAGLCIRPPGHHAESERAMGFCLLNNVAIAAAQARKLGAARVAILDWDVHHGNGTQEMFWSDPKVLYLSVHQFPFYPGSGANDEIGKGHGQGYTVNVPLPGGMAEPEYLTVFDRVFVPTLRRFDPTLILVSAGYDAHRADPLAGMRLEASSYFAMAHRLRALGKPLVFVLEGGYDLEALSDSVAATFDALLGVLPQPSLALSCHPSALVSCERTERALAGTTLGESFVERLQS